MDGDKKTDYEDPGGKCTPEISPVSDTPPVVRPRTNSKNNQGSRSRHSSGTNPNVRGIIIESQSPRDSSPLRSSPRISPGPLSSNLSFTLPPDSGSHARITSSTSDYVLAQGGARPKTNKMDSTQDVRPKSDYSNSEPPYYADRRNTISVTNPHTRRSTSSNSEGDRASGNSPMDVVGQSKEILKNYMFERYNKDVMSPEGQLDSPQTPTMFENFSPDPKTNLSVIGRQLALIGDDVDAKYSKTFKELSKMLNIRRGAVELAYEAFRNVCRKLFEDGIVSWGRIVTLIQFGYHLAMDVLIRGTRDFMSDIISYLVRFIATETIRGIGRSIAEWISSQGGWQNALRGVANDISNLSLSLNTYAALLAITITGAFLIWRFWPR